MKLMLATLVVALVASGAAATCQVTTTCGAVGDCDPTKCPNCKTVNTCVPYRRVNCPRKPIGLDKQCYFLARSNGCGGTWPGYTCRCASGRPCNEHENNGKCCPRTCTAEVNGYHARGTCASAKPSNTFVAGEGTDTECPEACGKCYVPNCPSTCRAHVNGEDVTGTCASSASSAPPDTIDGGRGSCPGHCGKCYVPKPCPTTCTAHVGGVDTPGTCASSAPANTYAAGSCTGTCGKCYVSCPSTCTVDIGGQEFAGTCASSRPVNTISGGQGSCPTGCGTECYIPSRAPGLCGTNGGPCAREGKCGCFPTAQGGNCQASNFLEPVPFPLPDNGGGCPENKCNALQVKTGQFAACCPQECDA